MVDDTKGITVKKADDMAAWYGQVVIKSELADYAPIRGFMVIRPNGYALWEAIQRTLDGLVRKRGVRNAYFPLLIPESFFRKEAEHAEGFSPEVAWIESKEGEERLAIRPTSETIMYDSYSRWIRSWRDLPLRINQWCNIVRWEVKDTKIFLRTREFLWQEGHCVYETETECHKETLFYLECYRRVAEGLLAVPCVVGRKTESEKFAGAKATYTFEGFMPDGKALQMGTSHDLGQNFSRAFDISFLGKDGQRSLPWQNSWGITTRLLGALVMTHGDDRGLVLPPRIASNKIAIVPIFVKDDAMNVRTIAAARSLAKQLARFNPILDESQEYSAGWKFNQYELQGIPLRVEIGPKDIESDQVVLVRRDTGGKSAVPRTGAAVAIRKLLDDIQAALFQRAKERLEAAKTPVSTWEEFLKADKDTRFIIAHHCGSPECEAAIKAETQGVTARCIPLRGGKSEGAPCVKCGGKASYRAFFARAY